MRGRTQQDVADCVDLTFQQVQKYERAVNRITAGKIYMFSEYLEVDILSFYKGLDKKEYEVDYSISDEELKILHNLRKIKSDGQRNSIKDMIATLANN